MRFFQPRGQWRRSTRFDPMAAQQRRVLLRNSRPPEALRLAGFQELTGRV